MDIDFFTKYFNGQVIGKYGENFSAYKTDDGNYFVTTGGRYICRGAKIEDFIMDKDMVNALIHFYCDKGYKDGIGYGDVSDNAYWLGRKLNTFYNLYVEEKESKNYKLEEEYLNQIKMILEDVKELHLYHSCFIDWFITQGSTPEYYLKDKSNQSVLNYYIFIKRFLTDDQRFYIEQDYELPFIKQIKTGKEMCEYKLVGYGDEYCEVDPKDTKLKLFFYCDSLGKDRKKPKYSVPHIGFMLDAEWIELSVSDNPIILNDVKPKTINVFNEMRDYVIKYKDVFLKHWNKEISDRKLLDTLVM